MSTGGSNTNGLTESNGLRSRSIKSTKSENEKKTRGRVEKPPFYYGGPKGALLYMVIAPIVPFVLMSLCTEASCTLYQWAHFSMQISDYFRWVPFLYLMIFLVILAIVTRIKLGPTVSGEPSQDGKCLDYHLNGIAYAVIVLTGIGVMILTKFPFTIILENKAAFVCYFTILSVVLSVLLYLKSLGCSKEQLNFYGNTGNVIYDMFMGRETNPRIGNLDIKFFLRHFGLFVWCAIDIAYIAYQNEQLGAVTHTLLLAGFGHALLMIDSVIFEENALTSFTVKHQGTGFFYIFNTLVLVPVLSCINVAFVFERGLKIDSEAYTIFLLGFIAASHLFYRFANSDKSSFLRYPDHPDVANYQYIPAINNKRILVDGWWSFSRHPNYLADIICVTSWCATTGLEDPLSYMYLFFIIPNLLYLIKINEDACRREFGDKAWDAYCEQVKYKLIKYIY